jgi:hypothetical protein
LPLPFLKKRQEGGVAGLIIKRRTPDEKPPGEDDNAAAIESCASELINAIHNKDIKAAAMALKDAFDILESMPHEEGEHTYNEQNQLAAENIEG